MKYYVYVIGTLTPLRKTYVGWTNDLDNRLQKHNSSKGAKSTRGSEWQFLHKEELESKSAAMKREYQLKRDRKFRSKLRLLIL